MQASDASDAVAALHHLTGASRGKTSWLRLDSHGLGLGGDGKVHMTARPEAPGLRPVARFTREGDVYRVFAAEGAELWVNRSPVTTAELRHGDMVEFGEDGPLSRFELLDERHPPHRTMADILEDTYAYMRASRRPMGRRVPTAMQGMVAEVLRETTLFFRLVVLAAIVVIVALVARQGERLERLGESVVEGQAQLGAVSQALQTAEEKALKPSDLALLREEIGTRLQSTAERLTELEDHWEAGTRVIAEISPAVAFLQGAFAFREKATGRFLRHVLDPTGAALMTPFGRPFLSLEGDGPIAKRDFNGTGVLLSAGKGMLTNRHVALPWEHDAASAAAIEQGLEPVMLRFVAYFPGLEEPVPVTLVEAGGEADLALLAADPAFPARPGVELADAPVRIGDPVIVMGYATGLRSMLAQAGRDFVEALQEEPDLDAEAVTGRLASAGFIRPLASRGIVGQVGPEAIVFDADTTHGGSGGPVLNLDGRVIALSSAIIPDYGGSNLGVPVARIRALLD